MTSPQLHIKPVGMESLALVMPPRYRGHHQLRDDHWSDYDDVGHMLPPGGVLGLPTSIRLIYFAVTNVTGVVASLLLWWKTGDADVLWWGLAATMCVPLVVTIAMGDRFQRLWSKVTSSVDG